MTSTVQKSFVGSIIVQIFIGGADIVALRWEVYGRGKFVAQLLLIEFVVQIIELIMYIALAYLSFQSMSLFTKYAMLLRYVDWMITTPTMLVTLMAFLSTEDTLPSFFKRYMNEIIAVLCLNVFMLVSGGISETIAFKPVNPKSSCHRHRWIHLGFYPFLLMFSLIYHIFSKEIHSDDFKYFLFFWFVVLWSMYGIVAFSSFTTRNISYNILDIFSKNITSLFLIWQLSKYRQTNHSSLHRLI